MAEDIEVLRAIWYGKIPICFQMSTEDIVSFQKPDPVYVSSMNSTVGVICSNIVPFLIAFIMSR